MSSYEFVSPIDGHRHFAEANKVECAVCELEAERDRLSVRRVWLRRAYTECNVERRAALSSLESTQTHLLDADRRRRNVEAERDRLRAVVEAFVNGSADDLTEALAKLDVTGIIGEEDEHGDVAGTGEGGHHGVRDGGVPGADGGARDPASVHPPQDQPLGDESSAGGVVPPVHGRGDRDPLPVFPKEHDGVEPSPEDDDDRRDTRGRP